MGIVRPVMEVHPYAWAFFVRFILIITFAVLNLFIAIVVNSMTNAAAAGHADTSNPEGGSRRHGQRSWDESGEEGVESILKEVRLLRREISTLQSAGLSPGGQT